MQSRAILFCCTLAALCGGCATPGNPDPWEKFNRVMYNVNDGIDRIALKPAADIYGKVIPKPIRSGIGNGFDNLIYFNVVFNDFLQGKVNQGLSDAGRMAVNSTIGIGGIFDVATPWGLPAHVNDFGITLGKWGGQPGPYLFIPILGPSDVRDVSGPCVEYLATPTTWLCLPYYITIPMYSVQTVDLRYRLQDAARFRSETALDPYVFTRDAYLQYRQNLIHEGAPPTTQQDIYDEDYDSQPATTQPASPPR